MSRVSNGNLIVLEWQNIHMISNIKERETERDRERQRETQRELHSLSISEIIDSE